MYLNRDSVYSTHGFSDSIGSGIIKLSLGFSYYSYIDYTNHNIELPPEV